MQRLSVLSRHMRSGARPSSLGAQPAAVATRRSARRSALPAPLAHALCSAIGSGGAEAPTRYLGPDPADMTPRAPRLPVQYSSGPAYTAHFAYQSLTKKDFCI